MNLKISFEMKNPPWLFGKRINVYENLNWLSPSKHTSPTTTIKIPVPTY